MGPTSPRLHRSTFLVTALVLAGLPWGAPPAEGAATTLEWDYDVRIPDPGSGNAEVTLALSGVNGILKNITFLTDQHSYPVTGVSSATGTLHRVRGGYAVEVDEAREEFTFTVDVRRPSASGDEYNAYLGPDWGVFRSEAFSLPYSYLFYGGNDFRWKGRIQFTLPDGWSAEGPWSRDEARGPNAFRLPENETLPRGFAAVGPFKHTDGTFAADREFRYVRLGNESDFEGKLFTYLTDATPYYENVYNYPKDEVGPDGVKRTRSVPVVGPVVLAVSAPAPMFRGGLGAPDSFYVRENSDLRTVAHEYAHVFQLFGTKGQPRDHGEASLWLNEGDADYHGLLSLFATDEWSLDQVNERLKQWDDERDDPPFADGRLVDAIYGNDLEDLAYHKGALVLHALDREMKRRTGGAAGAADLLQALNAAHDPRIRESSSLESSRRTAPVTNAEIEETASRIAGVDLHDFFRRHVHGSEWPPFDPVTAEGTLVLTDLTVTPSEAEPGAPVIVSVTVVNRGHAEAEKRIPLTLDGTEVGTHTVTLPRFATRTVNFTLSSDEAGAHEVRALYLSADFRVLLPADFTLKRISTVPVTPRAGEPVEVLVFVQNEGEVGGTTTVTLDVDGRAAAPPQMVVVPGGVTQAVGFTLTVDSEGRHTLKASATTPEGTDVHLEQAVAFTAPETNPGVFADPGGNGSGPIVIPGPGMPLLVALVGVVAAALRRRSRPN